MDKDNYIRDKSYGVIGANRVSGSSRELFMSDVEVSEFVEITIQTAEVSRNLNTDWVFGDKRLISVRLSPLQWAEMLTCMNVGDGVPCTIAYIDKEGFIEYKPLESKIQIIEKEAEERVDKGLDRLKESIDTINTLIKQNKIGKGVGEDLKQALAKTLYDLGDGTFYKESAKEEISKMVTQAKAEVSAFVDHKIYSAGLESIKDQLKAPKLPEMEKELLEENKLDEE